MHLLLEITFISVATCLTLDTLLEVMTFRGWVACSHGYVSHV